MVYTPFLSGQRMTADRLNERLTEAVTDWTDLDDIGNYATNFSAGTPAPRMRKITHLGTDVWEFEGRIVVSGGALAANTTTTCFTFDADYRPGSERGGMVLGSNTDHFAVRLTFNTDGTVKISVPTEASGSCTGVWLDNLRITNPT